jgi:hypothetical protein
MSEQREKGIAPKYELKEYQSAKIVMTDFYKYGRLGIRKPGFPFN